MVSQHQAVLAHDFIIFTNVSRYQICIAYLIAQVVPADRSIFTNVGRYRICTVYPIAQEVSADHFISAIVGRYRICIEYLSQRWYRPTTIHIK